MDRIPTLVEDLFPRVVARDLQRSYPDQQFGQRPQQRIAAVDISDYINTEILAKTPRRWAGTSFINNLQDFEQNYARAKPAPSWPRGWQPVDVVPTQRSHSRSETSRARRTAVITAAATTLGGSSAAMSSSLNPPTLASWSQPDYQTYYVLPSSPSSRGVYMTAPSPSDSPLTTTILHKVGTPKVSETIQWVPVDETMISSLPAMTLPSQNSRKQRHTSAQTLGNTTEEEALLEATSTVASSRSVTTTWSGDSTHQALLKLTGEEMGEGSFDTATTPESQLEGATTSHLVASRSTSGSVGVLNLLAKLWTDGAPATEKATTDDQIYEDFGMEPWDLELWGIPAGVDAGKNTSFDPLEEAILGSGRSYSGGNLRPTYQGIAEVPYRDIGAGKSTSSTSPLPSSSSSGFEPDAHGLMFGSTDSSTSVVGELTALEPDEETEIVVSDNGIFTTGPHRSGSSTSMSPSATETGFSSHTATTDEASEQATSTSSKFDSTNSSPSTSSSSENSSTNGNSLLSSSTSTTDYGSSSSSAVEAGSTSTAAVDGTSSTSSEPSSSTSSQHFLQRRISRTRTRTSSSSSSRAATSTSNGLNSSSSTDLEIGADSSSDADSTSDVYSSSSSEAEVSSSSTASAHTSSSSSSGESYDTSTTEEMVAAAVAAEPLSMIKHTFMKTKSPLEALIEQSDMRLIAETVKSNDKFDMLKMISMTLFIPVDSAFAGLPFDLNAVKKAAPSKPVVTNATTVAPATNVPEDSGDSSSTPVQCLGCQSMMTPRFVLKTPMDTAAAASKVMKDFESLVMYHVVRRQIPPAMIEKRKKFSMRTEMNGAQLPVELVTNQSTATREAFDRRRALAAGRAMQDVVLVGESGARVLEVVHCKNGFLYKLDRPLTPAFNAGAPTLVEYVNSRPEYSKLKFFFKHSHIFDGWVSQAGPISVFLIKDDGWKLNGLPVPDCFFKALVRPANRDMLLKILGWVTVPGVWRRRDIEESQWLMSAQAPALMVNHIYRPVDLLGKQTAYYGPGEHPSNKSRLDEVLPIKEPLGKGRRRLQAKPPRRSKIDAEETSTDQKPVPTVLASETTKSAEDLRTSTTERKTATVKDPFGGTEELVVLVEGKEVIEWNIPLYNGFGHVLSELPLRPDVDLTPILWDCMDFLCTECPIVTKYILKWLDNGGLLPDASNPKAYIVPNGVRPDWVCSNHRNWFPAGWDLKEWKKYIESAQRLEEAGRDHSRRGADVRLDQKHVQKMAKEGWTKAGQKREQLLDQYEEARVHLKRIYAYYSNPQDYVLGRREDPSLLLGFLVSHRDLEILPGVCQPREHAYKRRHGFPQQKDRAYLDDMDGDDVGLSYDDWKYITQWI